MSHWHDIEMINATEEFHSGNLQTALTLFLVGSERGYLTAQINSAYLLDKGMAPTDSSLLFNSAQDWDHYSFALPLFLRAANQGDVDSRVRVGDYYFYGYIPHSVTNESVPVQLSLAHKVAWNFNPNYNRTPSYEHALAHYSAAASGELAHSSIAMYNLGYMYEYGFGVTQDYHLAKRWYDLSLTTNPGAFFPIQLCLSFLHAKWMIKDFLAYFAPEPATDIHPPIPPGLEDESKTMNASLILKILESLSFVMICMAVGYLFTYRQRLLPEVDAIMREVRAQREAVERHRRETNAQEQAAPQGEQVQIRPNGNEDENPGLRNRG